MTHSYVVNGRLGDKISKEVSAEFPDPVFLEFEKVMFPSMLVNRKRYAGLTWTSPTQTKGVIDVKGIEGATRRDSVPIIAKIMTEIMDLLFPLEKNNQGDKVITHDERRRIIENVQKAVEICVRRILGGQVDVGEFIMTRVVLFEYYR
jgi:DNA polymerase delta subunit 1